MNLKRELCTAFCAGIDVQKVKAGLVVGTPFEKGDGDRVGFYLTEREDGLWRLEDDGMTAASLIASGVDVQMGERGADFQRMIASAGARFDGDSMLISSNWLAEGDIPTAALRFAALLVRLPELQMLHPDRVASTFREDVRKEISRYFSGIRSIAWDCPSTPILQDFVADVVLEHDGNSAAVFIANSDTRIYEAVMARALSRSGSQGPAVKFIAVLESERPRGVSIKAQQRARNYLDAAPSFQGDPGGAMARIADLLALSTRMGMLQ